MKTTRKNRNFITLILAVITLLLLIFILLFYFSREEKGSDVAPAQSEALDIPFKKQGELAFIEQQNSDTLARIDIEMADDVDARARGLMYRRSIPENAGMLFIQEVEEIQSFWMKNTFIPLDILFVDTNKRIVTIHTHTATEKEWNYASTEPALYVVEVNAGFSERHGIDTGDRIEFTLLK